METIEALRVIYPGLVLGLAYLFFVARRRDPLFLKFYYAVGLLYPLGKLFQVYQYGPEFLTGYLGDIGFLPCVGACYVALGPKTGKTFATARLITVYLFVLAVGYEFFVMQFNSELAALSFAPKGDWWDVAIFVATFIPSVAFLGWASRVLYAAEEERERQQRYLAKKSRKEARKRKTRSAGKGLS